MKSMFCGWYFKVESEECGLALIPAVYQSGLERFASLQILWNGKSGQISIPPSKASVLWSSPRAVLDGNCFCPQGMLLSAENSDWKIQGKLRFSPLTPLKIPVMGPFELIPLLECRHRIGSMEHEVNGFLRVNGRNVRFKNARGYIEGDRGRSFPREYAWSQCLFPGGSLMLAAARVPLGPLAFSGVIALLRIQGKEYRFASYLGARLVYARREKIVIRQGKLALSAQLLGQRGQPLQAPVCGRMERTIHENLRCQVRYCLYRDGSILWQLESDRASFELEYPE